MAKRSIGSVGLVIKRGHSRALALGAELAQWLRSRGLEILAEPEAASQIDAVPLTKADLAQRADLIVVLGGDGTLLSIARFVGERETPILGINLGALGFLTHASMDGARSSLERVLDGDYTVDRRITLEARVISSDGNTGHGDADRAQRRGHSSAPTRPPARNGCNRRRAAVLLLPRRRPNRRDADGFHRLRPERRRPNNFSHPRSRGAGANLSAYFDQSPGRTTRLVCA